MKVTKFGFEAQLLRWTESSNGGATIVLQLQDADDLAIFKTMTLAKKGTVGQRLAIAVAEIDDQEQLVPHEVKAAGSIKVDIKPHTAAPPAGATPEAVATPSPGQAADAKHKAHFPAGFCGLAVQWGDDALFREWLAMEFQTVWEDTKDFVKLTNKTADIERTALAIKRICEVTSRKELDEEPARSKFEDRIRKPYMTYLKEGA